MQSLQHRLAELSKGGAPVPAIQNSTHNGKALEPQICTNYNITGFWLPADWFEDDSEVPYQAGTRMHARAHT